MSDKPSGIKFPWSNMSPKQRRIYWLQQFFLPVISSILTFISIETIKDRATLFFTFWTISFSFVFASYAIVKFEPLRNKEGRHAFFNKLIFIAFVSILHLLAVVSLVTQFVVGFDIPAFTFDWENQLLIVYLQKVYVIIFVYAFTWITSFIISKKTV